MGDDEAALKSYQKAKECPDCPDHNFKLARDMGRLAHQLDKPELAQTALTEATEAAGGWGLTGCLDEPLFLHHLAVRGFTKAALSRGAMAFQQAFAPGGGYARYRLARAITAERLAPSPDRLLALLALTRWDPDILYTFAEALSIHQEALTGPLRQELLAALSRVGERVYAIPGDDDVDRLIAGLCTALSDPAGTAAAWKRNLDRRGPSVEALHGRALALSMLGQPEEALACIEDALPMADVTQRANLQQWAMALRVWSGGL